MFNTSLRRAARSCPSKPIPNRPTTPSIASFTSHSHQRRHSSSKPPVPPNNGSPTIPASAVKQVGGPKTESKKPASESRLSKRRASKSEVKEEQQDNWAASLPSVPSLYHLNPKDINIAAFYATYRPISVTGPGPKEAPIEEVDKIFQPKPKLKFKPNPQGVIYTLSSALENLQEQITDQQPASQQEQNVSQKADLIKQLTQNNEASSSSQSQQTYVVKLPQGTIQLDIQKIQNRFRPFNTPPAPTPISQEELDRLDREQAAAESEADAETNEEMQARTLESEVESQDIQNDPAMIEAATQRGRQDRQKLERFLQQQDGESNEPAEIVFNIPSSQLPNFFNPSQTYPSESSKKRTHRATHVHKRKASAGAYIVRRGQRVKMQLISVKRQRRLKMKKHKYKKLMRKTRNLRRRQDKL